MTEPLVIRDIHKTFGSIRAVAGVSLSVRQGSIFGLIGPDGAGKTTIMRILASLLSPDNGSAFLLGREIHNSPSFVRRTIGYMPQRFSLYQDLTVSQNLDFFASIFGVQPSERKKLIHKLYSFSGLAPFARRRARDLSGGMKQKLALSCILLHSPPVLVLDEPTFGVDPLSRQELWAILHELASEGTSILVSTPYMDEAAQCDAIGLIHEGSILTSGSPQSIIDSFTGKIFTITTDQPYRIFEQIRNIPLNGEAFLFGEGVHVIGDSYLTVGTLTRTLTDHQVSCTDVQQSRPGLEDIFLTIVTRAGGKG